MIEQLIIALTTIPSIWLTQQSNENWKKYACLFGLVAQPFWFYTTYINEQWGMFAVTIACTYSWYLGLKNNWWINESKLGEGRCP